MAVTSPPFTVDLGDDVVIEIPVDLPGGAPAVLTGATLAFGYGLAPTPEAHENAGRPSAAPQLCTATIRGVVFPTINAGLPAAETRMLKPYTTYYWAARVTIDGSPRTVARGSFVTAPAPL